MDKIPSGLLFSLRYWGHVWSARRTLRQIKRLEEENDLMEKKILYIKGLVPAGSVVYLDSEQRIAFYRKVMAKNDAEIKRLKERYSL